MRRTIPSVILLALVLTGCGDGANGDATASPSPSHISDVTVTAVVTSNRDECSLSPFLVPAGSVSITVTAIGRVPISVSVFAPEKGAFTDRLARVRILESGESKAINLSMTPGAYEIACENSGRSQRSRLTVTQ